MLGLGLEQCEIEIEDNHILTLPASEQPYKLQEFGDETLLGHQNLHAWASRLIDLATYARLVFCSYC